MRNETGQAKLFEIMCIDAVMLLTSLIKGFIKPELLIVPN